MKKVLFIGDIHGRVDWRETANEGLKKFEEVVFLGDYFDSFDISAVRQIDNFKALLAFLRKRGGTALLGNHDYAYIHSYHSISGYQFSQAPILKQLLEENRDLFKIAWGYTNPMTKKYTLVTHAGLTFTYWKRHVLPLFEGGFMEELTGLKEPESLDLHEILNYLIDKKELMWKVGSMRGGVGTPGPLWADIRELVDDPYPDINQVVGHTASHSISLDFLKSPKGDGFIARVDSFGKNTASLVVSL